MPSCCGRFGWNYNNGGPYCAECGCPPEDDMPINLYPPRGPDDDDPTGQLEGFRAMRGHNHSHVQPCTTNCPARTGDMPFREYTPPVCEQDVRELLAHHRAEANAEANSYAELQELRQHGDLMQSAGARILAWLTKQREVMRSGVIPNPEPNYETAMALNELEDAIAAWTETRKKST